ncbi:MAG: hypothetical protein AAGF12_14500 [Myxococcota bacterium]
MTILRTSLVLATSVLFGCAGSVPAPSTAAPDPLPEQLSAALTEALDSYEAEVSAASTRWYPSYEASAAVSANLAKADLDAHLVDALAARGLTLVELNRYAEQNPHFVRQENARYEARVATLRPSIYAVLGRIDPEHPSLQHVVDEASVLAASTDSRATTTLAQAN